MLENSLNVNGKLNYKQRRPGSEKRQLRLKLMLTNTNKRRSLKRQIKTKVQSVKKTMREKRSARKTPSSCGNF